MVRVAIVLVREELQFTISSNNPLPVTYTNKGNSPSPAKEDKVQIVTNDELPFLEMKMSWSPEGDLQFSVFRKKVQQLKYVGKECTHTPGTLRAIPSVLLNHLAKLTS